MEAEAGNGTAALMEVFQEIEAVAQELYDSTCAGDGDCGDGERCSSDPTCRRLNFECGDAGVQKM